MGLQEILPFDKFACQSQRLMAWNYVIQGGLKLTAVLLSQPPGPWTYECPGTVPSVFVFIFIYLSCLIFCIPESDSAE